MSAISIIIPNYNGALWLSKTLESCLLQKGFIKEIIIVDDYSTDNSLEILVKYTKLYPELIKVYLNEQKGGNNARNYGYSKSTGEFIQWLDADDQLFEFKFRDQLNVFNLNEFVDIVFSDWILNTYDFNGVLIKEEYKKCKPVKDFLYELILDNWTPPNNYLLKRSIAEQLNKFDAWNPLTKVAQDREYFTMAALLGAKFEYVNGFFSVYNRWNKNSVSADINSEKYRSLDTMFGRFEKYLLDKKNISSVNLCKYFNAINTQRALLNIYGFPSQIRCGNLSITRITWSIVHGIRTKIKLFIWVIFKK
ncbi:MAG: glycosyltransferase family A protein [Bacteroidetes bacterium]|nr:glycosyltransferase family A protein [Bacteroidota bacterium]